MRSLLDVNVLLALLDPAHIHASRAHAWFAAEAGHGWATCPITENGFVRILSQPSYGRGLTPAAAIQILREATDMPGHMFWPDDVSIVANRISPLALVSARQITDVYLLALAVENGGRFVTLDGRIATAAVVGASPAHCIVL